MNVKEFFKTLLLFVYILVSCVSIFAQETVAQEPVQDESTSAERKKYVEFTLRFGQGGFYDDRSEIGKLGGGQLALDVKPKMLPVALSYTAEYYTNSADPTHSYEISGLYAFNLLYMDNVLDWERVKIFAGGGIGGLEVPVDGTDDVEKGTVYNLEAGLNFRIFWKFGVYAIYKYLYAHKEESGEELIDFSEHIVLVGLSFSISL